MKKYEYSSPAEMFYAIFPKSEISSFSVRLENGASPAADFIKKLEYAAEATCGSDMKFGRIAV